MYLKRIISENVGPIEKVDIKPSFNDDGSPKPLILVGENGSGKSTLLSNIVDSFYDFANEVYSNVMIGTDSFSKTYYKAILPLEIHSGKKYMYSYLSYDNPNASYFFKSGVFEQKDFRTNNGSGCPIAFSWDKEGNVKKTTISKDGVKNAFEKNVVCYFGPDRYEKPVWMAKEYYNHEESNLHLTIKANWDGVLKNPITVKNATNDCLHWLLDVIVDSRADVSGPEDNLQLAHLNGATIVYLRKTRENAEQVLSKILGRSVYFSLNLRNFGMSRFCIKDNKTNEIVVPTLDSLSTGQLALLNIFLTIVRYGELKNVRNSVSLDEISGIVVIDEIELHLHSNLQKEILPKLIKLFPKVQFIITSHSPLFLLGMQDTFGADGFDVIEMPSGNNINVERFSEFQKAYDYYQHTQKHQEEIDAIAQQIKEESSNQTLVITEGATDWKHLKAAYNALKDKSEYSSLFHDLNFKLLEYEPKNSDVQSSLKMAMCADELKKICENFAKVPQSRKYIFVADCDKDDVTTKLGGNPYKDWGNNVYSLVLPVPESRTATPKICIEHLYSDQEIKTEYEISGKKCRLFMGSEFDSRGVSASLGLICENSRACGPQSIAILEGSMGEKITPFADSSDNRGLSKMMFANNILNKIPPFDNFDFSNFIKIFEIIKEICNKEMV